MLFKYASEEFLTLVTQIKNLVEFEIASYSVTSTLQQTNFRHTLIMNLKLILELNNDGELIIIDNIPLAFHKKEHVSLNHLISTQVVDVINYNNVNQISDEEIEALNIAFFADFYEYILFYNTNTYGNKFITFVDHKEHYKQQACSHAKDVRSTYSIEQHMLALSNLYNTFNV